MRGVIVSSFIVLALLAMLLAACGQSGQSGASVSPTATTPPIPTSTPTPAGPTITMINYSWSPTTLAIKAGQAVTFTFSNQWTETHIDVTGKNGQYIAEPGAPPEFNSPTGTTFNPGDTKSIVFANAGTFDITCTLHPPMQLTIKVSA